MYVVKQQGLPIGQGYRVIYGTVIVRGTGGTFETFDKIAHPNELRRQVQRQKAAWPMVTRTDTPLLSSN